MVLGLVPQLKLQHLQIFLTVVDEMNFSRAAEQLGMAQPPLSRQIKRLELGLDVQLFDRSSSQISLTEAGKIFAERSRSILAQVEQSIELAQMVEKGMAGQLIIGVDSAAPACVRAIKIIEAYKKEYPQVNVQVQELSVQKQLHALQAGNIDIGFATPQSVPQSLNTQVVVQEPLVMALPTEHPLAQHSKIPVAAIANQPLIMDSARSEALATAIATLDQSALFIPRVVQNASDSRLMLSFVTSNVGLAIVPASVENSALCHGVVYRPLEPPIKAVSLSVIWRQQKLESVIASFLNRVAS